MDISDSGYRLLRKIASQDAKAEQPFTLDQCSDDDRHVFSELKALRLVHGWSCKDGLDICLSESGRAALQGARAGKRFTGWLLTKIELIFDSALSHLTTLAAGAAAGWIAKSWFG